MTRSILLAALAPMNLGRITATVARDDSVIRADQIRTSYTASPKSAVNCDSLYVQWSNIWRFGWQFDAANKV